jgi:hypothetical protein
LVGRQSFTAFSEYFHKASVVFFYRGVDVTVDVLAQIGEQIPEKDQAFTFYQAGKRELQ